MSDEYPQSYEECQRIIDKRDASKRLQRALAPGDLATRYQSACDYAYELEKLLTKYMACIIDHEGIPGIRWGEWGGNPILTKEEAQFLRELVPEARKLVD